MVLLLFIYPYARLNGFEKKNAEAFFVSRSTIALAASFAAMIIRIALFTTIFAPACPTATMTADPGYPPVARGVAGL